MPRIQSLGPQVTVGGSGGLPRARPNTVPSIGGITQGLDALTDELDRIEQRTANVDAFHRVADAQVQAMTAMSELQQNAELGAPGFFAAAKNRFDEIERPVVENAHPLARDSVTQSMAQLRTQFLTQATNFQAAQAAEFRATRAQEHTDLLANLVRSNPDMMSSARERARMAIEEIGFRADVEREQLLLADQAIVSSSIQGMIDVDPDGTRERLFAGEFDAVLDPEDKQKFLEASRTRAESDLRLQIRLAERSEDIADREREESQRNTFQEALPRVFAGSMDEPEIIGLASQGDLSPSQMKTLQTIATATREGVDDRDTVLFLTRRIHLRQSPETIPIDIANALTRGQLSVGTARQLYSQAATERDEDVNAEVRRIDATLTGQTGMTMGFLKDNEAERATRAINDFLREVDQFGDTKPIREIADGVISRYRTDLPPLDVFPRPLFLDGAKTRKTATLDDLDAAYKETWRRFNLPENHPDKLDRFTATREMDNIEQMMDVLKDPRYGGTR